MLLYSVSEKSPGFFTLEKSPRPQITMMKKYTCNNRVQDHTKFMVVLVSTSKNVFTTTLMFDYLVLSLVSIFNLNLTYMLYSEHAFAVIAF